MTAIEIMYAEDLNVYRLRNQANGREKVIGPEEILVTNHEWNKAFTLAKSQPYQSIEINVV